MPIYQFACQECGAFEERRSIASASDPARCPQCQQPATRVITAPNFPRMARGVRTALEREEKSRYEPDVVSSKPPRQEHEHSHGPRRPWQIGH